MFIGFVCPPPFRSGGTIQPDLADSPIPCVLGGEYNLSGMSPPAILCDILQYSQSGAPSAFSLLPSALTAHWGSVPPATGCNSGPDAALEGPPGWPIGRHFRKKRKLPLAAVSCVFLPRLAWFSPHISQRGRPQPKTKWPQRNTRIAKRINNISSCLCVPCFRGNNFVKNAKLFRIALRGRKEDSVGPFRHTKQ